MKDLIKEAIKEMIRDGEITIEHSLFQYKIGYDDFGNGDGCLESIELESWLEVKEDEQR